MKKLYCVIWGKYRKFENPKISYLSGKKTFLSMICRNCKNEGEKFFKEEESNEIQKILGLIQSI